MLKFLKSDKKGKKVIDDSDEEFSLNSSSTKTKRATAKAATLSTSNASTAFKSSFFKKQSPPATALTLPSPPLLPPTAAAMGGKKICSLFSRGEADEDVLGGCMEIEDENCPPSSLFPPSPPPRPPTRATAKPEKNSIFSQMMEVSRRMDMNNPLPVSLEEVNFGEGGGASENYLPLIHGSSTAKGGIGLTPMQDFRHYLGVGVTGENSEERKGSKGVNLGYMSALFAEIVEEFGKDLEAEGNKYAGDPLANAHTIQSALIILSTLPDFKSLPPEIAMKKRLEAFELYKLQFFTWRDQPKRKRRNSSQSTTPKSSRNEVPTTGVLSPTQVEGEATFAPLPSSVPTPTATRLPLTPLQIQTDSHDPTFNPDASGTTVNSTTQLFDPVEPLFSPSNANATAAAAGSAEEHGRDDDGMTGFDFHALAAATANGTRCSPSTFPDFELCELSTSPYYYL